MGWTVRRSNPGGARFSAPVQNRPGAHAASYSKGTGSFPGVKRPGRGVEHPPHLAPRLKSTAIPLLPFWAFVACSRVNFTFIFTCMALTSPAASTEKQTNPVKQFIKLHYIRIDFLLPSCDGSLWEIWPNIQNVAKYESVFLLFFN